MDGLMKDEILLFVSIVSFIQKKKDKRKRKPHLKITSQIRPRLHRVVLPPHKHSDLQTDPELIAHSSVSERPETCSVQVACISPITSIDLIDPSPSCCFSPLAGLERKTEADGGHL